MTSLTQFPELQQKVLVSETFHSIQGEGKLVGAPSFFIRLSGCNLRCKWCDTPYASWNPEGTQQSLAQLVQFAVASKATHIVLTGGEPMLFDACGPLTCALHRHGFHITIETAGTIHRKPAEVACDLMSISPKLSNSTPVNDPRDPSGQRAQRHESRRLDVAVLQHLIDDYREHQLKFVVASPGDIYEIQSLLAQLKRWKPSDVLLMPEGVTIPSAATKAWITDLCVKNNFRYCPRLHIELFGNVRGT